MEYSSAHQPPADPGEHKAGTAAFLQMKARLDEVFIYS